MNDSGIQVNASCYTMRFLCIHLVYKRQSRVVDNRSCNVLTCKLCCIEIVSSSEIARTVKDLCHCL